MRQGGGPGWPGSYEKTARINLGNCWSCVLGLVGTLNLIKALEWGNPDLNLRAACLSF